MTTEQQSSESVMQKIRCDAAVWARVWGRPPSLVLYLRLILLEPGFQLALSIRAQEALTQLPLIGRLLRRILWYFTTVSFGSDIDPQAQISGGIYFPHPLGIVIGGGTRIGRNVNILQGVTLGRGGSSKDCPFVADGASVLAGAKVIGGVAIGEQATVGANAVLLTNVPAGCTAVGVPARIILTKSARNDRSC